MAAENHSADDTNPEEGVATLLSYAELLTTPRLARLYVYVLQHGPVSVQTVTDDLDLPNSTAYKYVGELEEMGLLTRHDEESPARLSVEPVRLELETEQAEVVATSALVAAVARQLDDEDIRLFVDRQGVAKLAAALHYTLRVQDGELTQRTAANRLGVHPVEGMTVITALQDVVEAATEYDPALDPE
jgi:predicted ArsR family transcriptional regulator